MPNNHINGWSEWSKHVLAELKRLDSMVQRTEDKLDELKIEIATLKARAGTWGAVTGFIAAIVGGLAVQVIARIFLEK